ncbi:MAG TPA: hypothetical protein VN108_11525 [Marmoricola sp.]|nr:hypothetical protein [Marmoricola sp.]
MVEVAAALSALVAVLCSGSGVTKLPRPRRSPRLRGIALVVTAVAFATLIPSHGGLFALAVSGLVGARWLAGKRGQRRKARATSRAVQNICAEIADDLAMGRVPEEAIIAAARRWPPLRPAASAAELHHDVPKALSELARIPGAAGLRDVSAAWQVSGRAGSGLADVLHEVTGLLAARERRTRLVDTELAAARATALVVSGLPVLVLGMGSGLGASPWNFFLSGLGTAVMATAGLLLFAGWAWLDRLSARVVG